MSNELTAAQPVTLSEQHMYAQEISKAAMLPQAYRGKPADVMIAIGLGNAIGIAPAQSLYEIYVVNGRPSPSANLMAALVRRAGHKLRIQGDATSCTATLVRADDPDYPFTATWTMQQAKSANLTGKDTWKAYPAAMLRSRAIAEVVRMGAPEAVLGMEYSREEMADVPRERVAPQPAFSAPEPSTPTDVEDEPKLTDQQRKTLFSLFTRKGIAEADQLSGIQHIIGRPLEHRDAITNDEFNAVVARLESRPDIEVTGEVIEDGEVTA